jgi:hypothetical protein
MNGDVPNVVCGFAWFVFSDPGREALPAAGRPFATSPTPSLLCWIEGTEEGIRNPIWGETYLILTDAPELPRVERGWSVEPADLEEGFRTGDDEVCLVRTVNNRRTPWGIVQQCEFVVARGASADDASQPAVLELRRGFPPGSLPGSRDRRG